MKPGVTHHDAGELVSVLERLVGLQEQLHAVVREKLEAMRRADTGEMTACAQREGRLAAEVCALERRRAGIVDALAADLSIPASPAARSITLRALAERLADPPRARLRQLGETLREKMLQVAEANRVVELVCREMLAHFNNLFSLFTQDEDGAATYSPAGAVQASAEARVLDAIG